MLPRDKGTEPYSTYVFFLPHIAYISTVLFLAFLPPANAIVANLAFNSVTLMILIAVIPTRIYELGEWTKLEKSILGDWYIVPKIRERWIGSLIVSGAAVFGGLSARFITLPLFSAIIVH